MSPSSRPGPTSSCSEVRESLSARADGEEAVLSVQRCEEHLAGCRACAAFAAALPELVRARLHEAQAVPDLTLDILAAAAAHPVEAAHVRRQQLRWTLGLVGVAQSLLALAALVGLTTAGDLGHVGRELATWQLALGIGFVVAAWQPHRAPGLLPMVAVLGLAAVVSAVGDLVAGATTLVAELDHLVEVAGVALVAGVAGLPTPPPTDPAPPPTQMVTT